MHYRGEVDHQSRIHSVIPTPFIKHVLVIPLATEQQFKTNAPLSYGIYLITENSKVRQKFSHTKLQLKDKGSIPSSQEIASSLVSTEVDFTIQSKETPNKR